MIDLHHLTKRFGRHLAVDALDLHVPRGVIFGLLGHNGAGKSTTIGMLLGQIWPSAGGARICGHEVATHRSRALETVGALFEAPAFYDYLSGWRNLEILAGYSAATPAARIREVIAWVGLSGREHTRVQTYSHGMRARLALAQALLPSPALLILDEPTNGLDPEGIHEMRDTIRRLHAEFGLTILLSSHLLGEVQQLCSAIAVLHRGRKVFDGSVAEATRSRNRVRLVTDDLPGVTGRLRDEAWITGATPDGLLTLRDGVECWMVVKRLVELGVPVHAASPEEETLERFYLSVVRQAGQAASSGAETSLT
ncbi:MAG: ABC transporter ATP-binding protein [Verrucomicrobiae bacterium]|nr:ABC transporter ATP-binding protein [Verrucomicrobiae bacterium]